MIKEVYYPKHVMQGIRPLIRGTALETNVTVFGMDTETSRGKPLTVQIDGGGGSYFSYATSEDIFSKFWEWIKPNLRSHGVNLCYVHNLSFDLRVLFSKWHKEMYRQISDINFFIGDPKDELHVSMLYGKVNKATIKYADLKLDILDSRAFTLAGLDASLKMFKIDAVKLDAPEDLGRVDFRSLKEDDPRRVQFETYAGNDARAERMLGERILDFHREYGVSPSISLPSFAAKVFRKKFMGSDVISFPPLEVVKASELSFHGGKNGYYADGPRLFHDLYEIDINSAYPAAMESFPGLTMGRYEEVHEFQPGLLGVYKLSGRATPNPYPVIFDHAFNPVAGDFTGLWHTGYETELALRPSNGVRISNLRGYVWLPDKGAVNPFAAFVRYFYGRKEKTPKSDPYYHFYKIVLNALFGKLIASVEIRSSEESDIRKQLQELGVSFPEGLRIDERWDDVLQKAVPIYREFKAGGLYNPFIATQITGFARKMLFQLEKKYEAVHSATDSIKTRVDVDPVLGLGGLKVECFGDCYIFRNKLYLHFAKDFSRCGHKDNPICYPAKKFKKNSKGELIYVPHPKAGRAMLGGSGSHLCKYALHAYKGPLWQLFENRERLLSDHSFEYDYVHVIGLREGLKRGETPCDFVLRSEALKLSEPDKEFRGDSINDREEVKI